MGPNQKSTPKLESSNEGAWEPLGQLDIGDDGAIAGDFKNLDDDDFAVEFDLAPHTYLVEQFRWDGECLGVRLIAELLL